MGKTPSYITTSAGADKFVRTVTGRVTVGQYQFLLDLAIEWGVDRSTVLRAIVDFATEWMPGVAEGNGDPLSLRACATARFVTAMRKAQEYKTNKEDVYRAYRHALSMPNGPSKDELLGATREYAKACGINWPPDESDVDLAMCDPDLRYVYDRVLRLTSEKESSRITIRDLAMSTGKNTHYLTEHLNELGRSGHVTLKEEHRSGQLTIWIEVPTMKESH